MTLSDIKTAMAEETLHDAYYRLARECAVWRERAQRFELTDAERDAISEACECVKLVGTEQCYATLRSLLATLELRDSHNEGCER